MKFICLKINRIEIMNTTEKTNCVTSRIFLSMIRLKNFTLEIPFSTEMGLNAEINMAGKPPESKPVTRAKTRNQI
jgi:hypothetical protein